MTDTEIYPKLARQDLTYRMYYLHKDKLRNELMFLAKEKRDWVWMGTED